MTIIKGTYASTYNGLDTGNTEVGFRKQYSYQGRNINFDAVGVTPVDIIFQGMRMTVDFVAMEYDAPAVDSLRWPFHATPGQLDPAGQSLWDLARPLILTACNVATVPATITFYKTILAPEFDLELEYSHRERPVPMRLMVLPVQFDATGAYAGATLLRPNGCNDIVYYEEA